jgi:hypothetical protein
MVINEWQLMEKSASERAGACTAHVHVGAVLLGFIGSRALCHKWELQRGSCAHKTNLIFSGSPAAVASSIFMAYKFCANA